MSIIFFLLDTLTTVSSRCSTQWHWLHNNYSCESRAGRYSLAGRLVGWSKPCMLISCINVWCSLMWQCSVRKNLDSLMIVHATADRKDFFRDWHITHIMQSRQQLFCIVPIRDLHPQAQAIILQSHVDTHKLPDSIHLWFVCCNGWLAFKERQVSRGSAVSAERRSVSNSRPLTTVRGFPTPHGALHQRHDNFQMLLVLAKHLASWDRQTAAGSFRVSGPRSFEVGSH